MDGHENLVPNSERTPEELREMTRKGGIKSGESRRKKRDIRKSVGALLSAKPDLDAGTIVNLRKLGFLKGKATTMTIQDIMDAAIIQKAMRGDSRCAELIHKIMGDFTETAVTVNVNTNEAMTEVEKYLYDPGDED